MKPSPKLFQSLRATRGGEKGTQPRLFGTAFAQSCIIENCAANEPLFLAVGCQLSAVGQKGQGYCLRRDQLTSAAAFDRPC
jgi:hypothetical protein